MEQTHSGAEQNPLGTLPIGKLLVQFAIPTVISMLIDSVYNMADQVFVGQGVGTLGIAGTTIAYPFLIFMLAISSMLGTGGSIVMSMKLGQGQKKDAEKIVGNIFIIVTVVGVLFSVLGNIFIEPLVWMFGATEQSYSYAVQYTSIILWGAPFSMISVSMSSLARSDGSPMYSMVSFLIGAVINLILDPIYIFIFGWGIRGAAIATITSQFITALLLLYFFTRKSKIRLHVKNFKLDHSIVKAVAGFGMSVCFIQVSAAVFQIVLNISMRKYGINTIAGADGSLWAMGIIGRVSNIVIAICVGIGIGIHPIIGFNTGAKLFDRVWETYKKACIAASTVSIIGWLLFMICPFLIAKLFGNTDPEMVTFFSRCMRIFLMGTFLAGFQTVSSNYILASGQIGKALILSILRQLILAVPLMLLLSSLFGFDGILFAGIISDILATVIMAAVIIKMNKGRKKEEQLSY